MATLEEMTNIVIEASTDLSISSDDFLALMNAWWDTLDREKA